MKHRVYKIGCKNCARSYIGETGRSVRVRLKEHERLIENSALTQHVRDFSHEMDFQNAQILFRENNVYKRKFLEALCLKKYSHFENNTGYLLNMF